GLIDIDELKEAMTSETILVSIMHVNNETGAMQPIKQIGEIVADYPKAYFHVDYVQGAGKVPLDIKGSHIDLCTFSGHKIHGLKGTGILYVKNGTTLYPLFHGGSQEYGVRSGTENVAGAVSFARALRLIYEKMDNNEQPLTKLSNHLRQELSKIDRVIINSTKNNSAQHILNISIPGIKSEVMIHELEAHHIYISTKSACSSKQSEDSRVLVAMNVDKEIAQSALRISLS